MRRLSWDRAREYRMLQRWYHTQLADGGPECVTPQFMLAWRREWGRLYGLRYNPCAPACVRHRG